MDILKGGAPIIRPRHFSDDAWGQYLKKGFQLQTYLALPRNIVAGMDAATFLSEALSSLMSSEEEADSYCIAARILAPNGQSLYLRLDRDYYEIYLRDSDGVTTLVTWQFAYPFCGYKKEELWCNMIALLEQHNERGKS